MKNQENTAAILENKKIKNTIFLKQNTFLFSFFSALKDIITEDDHTK